MAIAEKEHVAFFNQVAEELHEGWLQGLKE